jgi:hypothetical protein
VTTEADYTPAEWRLLMEAPGAAALAVIAADKSGIFGMAREIMAVSDRLEREHETAATTNQLIAAVLAYADREEPPGATVPNDDAGAGDEGRQADPARAKADAIERATKIAALLSEKSTPEEADGFKRWLLDIAQTAANASKEGGFLGIGGTRVSAEEAAALDELRTALGMT